MSNHFVGTKKQLKVRGIVDRVMRVILLPITFPLFILRWLAYNIEEIMFGLDKYVYEPIVDKVSTLVAKKF